MLIAVASKHGATREIAGHIGEILGARGFDITVQAADDTDTLEGYEGVVLGSAVYAGRWMKEARALAESLAAIEPTPATWLFSSGPVGDPLKPEEDPVDVAAILETLGARDHQVFAGKIDKSKLGFAERAIVTALRAPEGDFRDWDEIASWAESIAGSLRSEGF